MLNESKIVHLYEENPKEFIFRILSYVLSSLILPNIIILSFIIYMSYSNFFSYDFFTDGIFGMKLFFTVAIFFLAALSLAIASSLIIIMGNKKDSKGSLLFKDWWFIYIINAIFIILFLFLPSISNMPFNWSVYLIIIAFALCFHIGNLIFYNAKRQFLSLIGITIGLSFLMIFFAKETSMLMAIGLRQFGIGGDIKTEIKISAKSQMEKGRLILVTPRFIYMRPNKAIGIKTYPINIVESYYVGTDINLSKK